MKKTLAFSEMLLLLLKEENSLVDALQILSEEGIEKEVKNNAISLLLMMKKGKGFSESLKFFNNGKSIFNPFYLLLISSAEATGNIKTVLEKIVIDMRKKQKVFTNVFNILIYPSIVVLISLVGTVLIIAKGIPLFVSGGMLSNEAANEAKAGIIIAGLVLLLGGSVLFFVYYRIFYNDSPEYRIFYLLNFLLQSNITLSDSLSHCITNLANTKYAAALVLMKKEISSGITLSRAYKNAFCQTFSRIKRFSPYIFSWLKVADTNSNLENVCGSIANYYAEKDSKKREIAARLIEPAVIILTGLYVFIILITTLLPILTRAGAVL